MRNAVHLPVLGFILLFAGIQNGAIAAEVPIVQSGQPMATIQIGATASEQERFAAEEIQTFVRRFTLAQLNIVRSMPSPPLPLTPHPSRSEAGWGEGQGVRGGEGRKPSIRHRRRMNDGQSG